VNYEFAVSKTANEFLISKIKLFSIMEKEIDNNEVVVEELQDDDSVDWKAEAQKYHRMAKQRGKKLEALAAKPKEAPEEQKPQDKPVSQSNEPDYARLAFLKSYQIEHPDDQKVIMDEASRLKLPLTDVLQMEHIKVKLNTNRDVRNAQLGMPTGNKRQGGVTQRDVDYWLQKGGIPEGDQELAEKVVDARLNKAANENKFSEVPFIG